MPHIGFVENIRIKGVAAKNHGFLQDLFGAPGPVLVKLDELHAHPRKVLLDQGGEIEADIATADDDGAAGFQFFVAEGHHGAGDLAAVDDEINLVASEHLFVGVGDDQLVLADNSHHQDIEIGEKASQLAQGRINDRAILTAAHTYDTDLIPCKGNGIEGAGNLQAPPDGPGDLGFRGNDHIDGHVIAAEQVGPYGFQVILFADAGDLGGHLEEGMGHLAGHYVDFVVIGNGHHHIGILRPGLFENAGMGGETNDAPDLVGIAEAADELRRLVNHRHIIVFPGEMAGNAGPHLTGAANDYLHETPSPSGLSALASGLFGILLIFLRHLTHRGNFISVLDSQGFQLSVQGGTLHADEGGGA